MRTAISIAIAATVTAGLAYACYEIWLLLEDVQGRDLRGTFVANFKYLPIVVLLFVFLSLVEIVAVRVDRMFESDD